MMGRCNTCEFYKPDLKNPPNGRCHFNPPVVFIFPINQGGQLIYTDVAQWPATSPLESCGKWQAKKMD